MNVEEIKAQAKLELQQERFKKAVEAEKERLRKHKPLWDRIFPWKITIERK